MIDLRIRLQLCCMALCFFSQIDVCARLAARFSVKCFSQPFASHCSKQRFAFVLHVKTMCGFKIDAPHVSHATEILRERSCRPWLKFGHSEFNGHYDFLDMLWRRCEEQL